MSQIINAIPPNALLPVAGALVGWCAHMLWFRTERAHVASGMARIRKFMRGNDEWLTGHQQRHAIEPKPVEAEVLHVEHATGELPALSDRPAADEDEVGDEQPGEWWTPLALTAAVLLVALLLPVWLAWMAAEWVWGKAVAAAGYVRERFKSNDTLAREFIAEADAAPWVLWDESELRAEGMSEQEIAMLREGFVKLPDIADEDELDGQRAEWVALNPPTLGPDGQRHWNDVTAMHGILTPGRHRKMPINASIPAQRDGGDE